MICNKDRRSLINASVSLSNFYQHFNETPSQSRGVQQGCLVPRYLILTALEIVQGPPREEKHRILLLPIFTMLNTKKIEHFKYCAS